MSWPALNTLLVITPLSGSTALELTPYSARGLTQTLEQFKGGDGGGGSAIRETIDGRTINLTPPWMQKYNSTITCSDVNTPCIDNAWRGLMVEVQCVCELNYVTGGTPQRPEVSGSSRTEGGITFYRPVLQMMLLDIRFGFQEYRATYSWQADLREIKAP